MKKVYVLDTNVILTDPNAFENFDDNEVVIPFIVIEELERHKTKLDEVGRNAREFSRKIGKYIEEGHDIRVGIKLENRGIVRAVSSNDFDLQYRKPSEINDDKADNLILSITKELTANTSLNVILVTQDTLLRIKAAALGIETQTYQNNRIKITEKSGLYTGHRVIELDKEGIDEIHQMAKSGESLDFSLGEEGEALPNEFITLKDPNSQASCLLRWIEKDKTFRVVKNLTVSKIHAKNREQTFALDLLLDPDVKLVTLSGFAGTGKTIVALAAGLHQVLDEKTYKSLVVCRPMQPVGKDIGFLPGLKSEKLEPWIAPIKDNLKFLLGGNQKNSKHQEIALEMLFERGTIEVEAMTYIRGRSIANAFMLIDEAQNLSMHELKTILTRAGEGTKIVLTGDIEQIDAAHLDSMSNGLTIAIEKFKKYDISGHVSLVKGERSALASLAAEVL